MKEAVRAGPPLFLCSVISALNSTRGFDASAEFATEHVPPPSRNVPVPLPVPRQLPQPKTP